MLYLLRMVEERFHRDDEGRPLREGRAPPDLLRANEIDYKPCPLPGSRYKHAKPMNVSALKQTSEHWDELMAALRCLRASYARLKPNFGPDLMDVWRVSQLASALPWFFVLRGEPIPAYAAALSKVTLGMGILGQRLLHDQLAGVRAPEILTAQRIVELSETTQTLVGESEVCPAPDKMVLRFSEAFVTGDAADAPLANLAESVITFGAHYMAFKFLLWLQSSARRFLHADCLAAYAAAGIAPPDELVRLREAPTEPPDFFQIEPTDLAGTPAPARVLWFRTLAQLLIPFAPDQTDAPLFAAAQAIALVMGDPTPPPDALVAELATSHPPAIAHAYAVAIAKFSKLDGLLGACATHVEAGFRRALGGPDHTQAIDAAVRDRVVMASPRAFYAGLAPVGLRSLALP